MTSPTTGALPVAGREAPFASSVVDHGQVAFVPAAGVVAAPVVAVPAWALWAVGGVLVLAARQLATSPASRHAVIRQEALDRASAILRSVPGLTSQAVASTRAQVGAAFNGGFNGVKELISQWRASPRDATASPSAGNRPTADASEGRPRGTRPARTPGGAPRGTGPRGPGPVAVPARPSAPQLSAADRQTLQSLRAEAAALGSQVGAARALTPSQLAEGGPLESLGMLERRVDALLGKPGAAAHAHELSSLKAQARRHVAGLYRLTVHKALAGLLTSPSDAGRATRGQAGVGVPYPTNALRQLLAQGQQVMHAATDAPLLAELGRRLANPPAPEPGRTPVRPSTPVPPGERQTIILAAPDRGGAATGEAAGERNRRALDEQAGAVERARQIVHARRRTLLPGGPTLEQLARAAYREAGPALRGVSEDAFVALAVAPGRIAGPDGAGRVRAGATGETGATGSGRVWRERDLPGDPDWATYFAPQPASRIAAEFRDRNRVPQLRRDLYHDAFSHLLQSGIEISGDPVARPNFADLVDDILNKIYGNTRGVDRIEAELKARCESMTAKEIEARRASREPFEEELMDRHIAALPHHDLALDVQYVFDQLRANAALNGISVEEFVRRLFDHRQLDSLLLMRPAHVPLTARPR